MLYKVLDFDSTAYHKKWVGHPEYVWELPQGTEPGRWSPAVEGDLEFKRNGIHLFHPKAVTAWMGPAVYVAQYAGEKVPHADFIIARQARLLKKTPWTFIRGAEWFARRFKQAMYRCCPCKIADQAVAFHDLFTDLEEAPMIHGNLHEVKGWRNGESSFDKLMEDIEDEIKSEAGKAPAEVFVHANLVVRFLMQDRKARSVEAAIVAFNKCIPKTREAFMEELLLWKLRDPEDHEVIIKSDNQPKGEFTPIPRKPKNQRFQGH
jgi:hypothetical protein